MANTISIDDLAAEVNDLLQEYGAKVYDQVVVASDEIAKETVKELRETSPKDSGAYAKAWRHSKADGVIPGLSYGRVVHVRSPHYRLTHLLEYGHALRQGGRAAARPHIKKAEQNAITKFVHRLTEGIKNAD